MRPRLALLFVLSLAPYCPAQPAEALPPHACPVPVIEKTIPSTQVLLVPREQATTLPDWRLRAVEVGRQPTAGLTFREERQYVVEMSLQAREVEQQVTVVENRPVKVTCPVTGKCHTEQVPCPVVKTVRVQVYETVPVRREVVVRVPVLGPGGEVVVNRLVLDQLSVPAVERSYGALTTQGEMKVYVPACPLPAPHH